MVLLREDPAGGGGSRKDNDPVTEEEIKKAKDIIDEFKKILAFITFTCFQVCL